MTYQQNTIVFEPIPTNPCFKDLTDRIFHKLTVLGYAGKKRNLAQWFCECICGTIKIIHGTSLKNNSTHSCGCWRRKRLGDARRTHGETPVGWHSPEYKAFDGAKQRCNNPKNKDYDRWGGRGIQFLFESFEEFLADVGRKPSAELTLDRKDVNGHYEVGNLRWVTQLEQQRNRRNRRDVTIDNITHCISEWAEILNIPHDRILSRLNRGWCPPCATTLALRQHCIHH